MSEQIATMFSSIAPTYDPINSILSLGIHHRWRSLAAQLSRAQPGDRVLDCATGTGDLALILKRRVGPTGHVVGVDFSAGMLALAPRKAERAGLQIDFHLGDILTLPYADQSFQRATIAFGIRNVADPHAGIAEMARVVVPGGTVTVLEFGQPSGILWGRLFRWYSQTLIPRIGGWLSGNRSAYEYLPRTSAAFPAGDRFIAMMRETGRFSQIECHRLSRGIAYVYVGTVAT